MKGAYINRVLLLGVFLSVFQQFGLAQSVVTADQFNPNGGDDRGRLLSTFNEFYKAELYNEAVESFWTIFRDFPDASEKFYVDGVGMYRYFIGKTDEGQARYNLVDTLMLIYDQRVTYFGGEGNILGRKGIDLLRYRGNDQEQVLAAYEMLKESVAIEGVKSRDVVLLNYITAGLLLQSSGALDKGRVMEDYFQVMDLMDQQAGSSSSRDRTRATIDEMVQKEGVFTCEGLNRYFEPQFEQNSEDRELLEKIINTYASAECNESSLYIAASEKLFKLDPGSAAAHNLAMLFIGRNDLDKAAMYLEMAVLDGELSNDTRAEWFYELSIVSLARGEECEAISYAKEARTNKISYGRAYIALGDSYIASRKQLGDDFQQRTAYWAAADMYQAAARVDTSLAQESGEKLAICTAQYPNKEDIFFQDLHVGSSFYVGGCIQENTTVRSRD
jgi:hypothetical protein